MLDAMARELPRPRPQRVPAPHGHPRCHRQPRTDPSERIPDPERVWYARASTPFTAPRAPRAGGPSEQDLPVRVCAPLKPRSDVSRRDPGRTRGPRPRRSRGALGALPAGPARGRCGPGPPLGPCGKRGSGGTGAAACPARKAERQRDVLKSKRLARLGSSLVTELLISSAFPARGGAGGSALSSAAAGLRCRGSGGAPLL